MAKGKKQVFKNIWNVIKKPLMVISIILNVLFFTIIFVSCASLKKSKVQVKAISKYEVYDLYDTTWVLNESFTDTPNGQVWLSSNNTPIQLEQYIGLFTFEAYDIQQGFIYGYNTYNTLSFGYDQNGAFPLNDFMYKMIDSPNDPTDILYSSFVAYQDSGWIFWTADEREEEAWLLQRTIKFTSHYYKGFGDNKIFNWLINNASLKDAPNQTYGTFTFSTRFNYYAPQGGTLNDFCVQHTWEQGVDRYYIQQDFPQFQVNGEIYNRIKLVYWDAKNLYFSDGANEIKNTTDNTMSYMYMQYINTTTNDFITVNESAQTLGGLTTSASYPVYLNGSNWLSTRFQTLVFASDLTNEQSIFLSQFNNLEDYDGIGASATDLGLAKAFSLLASAFTSLIPLMKIQLLPGITLGLLIFIPLVVGIIITVIWLVKR